MTEDRAGSASPLDRLLPLLDASRQELHLGAAVLESADPAQLLELAANPKIGRYLLARLCDTVALVDPGREEELAAALLAAGHTPKRSREAGS